MLKQMGAPAEADLISCLMVTRLSADRIARVAASISTFQAQTYAPRELVILIDDSAETAERAILHQIIRASGPAPIRIATRPGRPTLGSLRNESIREAMGEYVCQWDDDDIYHPERLAAQLAALRAGNHEAVYLQEVLQFFPETRALYWTNWRATESGGHPGSLFMRRDLPVRYPTEGAEARLGEDLVLARALWGRGKVGLLAEAPHLFAYVSHGANSWAADHHGMLARELAISRGLLMRRETSLRQGLPRLDLGQGAIQVCGANGPAFIVNAV